MSKKKLSIYFLLGVILLIVAACDNGSTSEQTAFLYISDTQSDIETNDYHIFSALLSTVALPDQKIDFVLHGGDAVNNGLDKEEWADFFAAYQSSCYGIPLYRARGNHDDTQWPPEYGAELDNGPYDGFYSFDYANVHVSVLNSNYMGITDKSLTDWLSSDLAQASDKWKIVVFHYPFYPSSDIRKDIDRAELQRSIWLPVLEEGGVDLVLNGHQHVYLRTKPLINSQPAEDGIIYLMAASGGKPNYELTLPEYVDAGYTNMSCVIFISGADKLTATAYNEKGIMIDEFTIDRKN